MNQTDFSLELLNNLADSFIITVITGLSFLVSLAIFIISYVKGNKEIIAQVLKNLTLSLSAYLVIVVQHIMKQDGKQFVWLKYSISASMNFVSIYDLLSVCAWTRATSHLSKTGSRTYGFWKFLFLIFGLLTASSISMTAYFFEDMAFHVLQKYDVSYTIVLGLLLALVNEFASAFFLCLAYRGQYIPIKSLRDWFLAYFDVLNSASNQPDKKTIPVAIYCSWNAILKTPFLFLVSLWIENQEKYQIILIMFNAITITFNIIQFKAKKERSRRLKFLKRLMGVNTVETYSPNAPNSQCFVITLPKSNRAKKIEEGKREEQQI